jgi:hypothetical protein
VQVNQPAKPPDRVDQVRQALHRVQPGREPDRERCAGGRRERPAKSSKSMAFGMT